MNKTKYRSLGRGLSSILGGSDSIKKIKPSQLTNSYEILINQIETNPYQPRKNFKQEELSELASSVKNHGIIQPITVRQIKNQKYQIISGERRYRASLIAKLKKIPAFVRKANDQQMLEMAIVENIQRENLNPIEIALSYKRLITECKLTQEACSIRIGKKRTTITNFLRLLKLPIEIQEGLAQGDISIGHARALININSLENQMNIYKDIIHNGYSVREVEQIAKLFKETSYRKISKNIKTQDPLPFVHQKLLSDLSKKINKKISVTKNQKGTGNIRITFTSEEELLEILTNLN